jgi:lipopolysaccharide export LptBFGC system permease protein LptF
MKTLLKILTKIPITEKEAESVLTELENLIESKVNKVETKMSKETILPIQKENDGIRAEIRLLTETMKNGFSEMDQKMDFIRENLESQIKSTRENLESQIKSSRENLELQIKSTRENLEIQIKSNKESLDKQLALQQKLLWAVLTIVFGLLVKTLVLS